MEKERQLSDGKVLEIRNKSKVRAARIGGRRGVKTKRTQK